MRFLVGLDDTDSSRGLCTTYLAYRISVDLRPSIEVLPHPRLVRLNPNVPFKTRGNAAVCLQVEAGDPDRAFELISSKVEELSDVERGANSGMVFLEDLSLRKLFRPLYADALAGLVNKGRVRGLLKEHGVRSLVLGNGMGLVGAASSLGFDDADDRTYELISYRRKENWGTRRFLDASSVKEMDAVTFPRTYNNYDYQKRKVLVAPHGPDPVFAGVRGDSPGTVVEAFGRLRFDEELDGWMVYATNQHTDAHLARPLEWKTYSSGWLEGKVTKVEVGMGGHVYFSVKASAGEFPCAAYEPTGDLRRVAKTLAPGDQVRVSGGVRRPTSKHTTVLNVEKLEVLSTPRRPGAPVAGTYIASPRANRHLTKPYSRYLQSGTARPGTGTTWLRQIKENPALARSP